jgi:hypothetical protein
VIPNALKHIFLIKVAEAVALAFTGIVRLPSPFGLDSAHEPALVIRTQYATVMKKARH